MRPLIYILIPVSTALLAGCGGTMTGVVRGEGTRVQFDYEQGLDRDFYTTVIDGERFSGQAIDAGATSGFGTVFVGDELGNVFVSQSSGNIVALLLGDRGSSLRCQMNYADSTGFAPLGGIGVCDHSDGRVIDVTW